ncbi:hypothetical protein ABH916_001817 [Peribacillus frigoritolerans]
MNKNINAKNNVNSESIELYVIKTLLFLSEVKPSSSRNKQHSFKDITEYLPCTTMYIEPIKVNSLMQAITVLTGFKAG